MLRDYLALVLMTSHACRLLSALLLTVMCYSLASCQGEKTENDSITPAEREALIDEFLVDVQKNYVFPDFAQEITLQIQADLDSGYYSNVYTADSLAKMLHKTVLQITHDKHFKVESHRAPIPAKSRAPAARPRNFGANHGFRSVEILPGNIGYLQMEMLPGSEEDLKVAAIKMARVKDCEALIYDIRDNEGGSGDMVTYLCNYLMEGGTLLFSFYDRKGNKVTDDVTDLNFADRLSLDLPVYVLVSEYTLSAAESFAYILQAYNRATIVGDTTAGMAHPCRSYTAQGRLDYTIPFLRFEHPLTKADWEGVGVIPDVVTDPDSALQVAISQIEDDLWRSGN